MLWFTLLGMLTETACSWNEQGERPRTCELHLDLRVIFELSDC